MNKQRIFKTLERVGVVPVIRSESPDNVIGAVEALIHGGIPVAEITMTIPDAIKVMARCISYFSDQITLGVGSVTHAAECQEAIDAGCLFVVTPVFVPSVIDVCTEQNVCVISGALTPTEIYMAWERGADAVKIFPVKAMGGAAYLRMVHDPLPQIPLMPTGGITLESLKEYFQSGAPFVGAGSDLVSKKTIDTGNMRAITDRARAYMAEVSASRRKLRVEESLPSGHPGDSMIVQSGG